MVAYGGHYMQGIRDDDIQYTPLPLYHSAGNSKFQKFKNSI